MLDRETRPDGTVAWNPAEYKDLIRKKVSGPLSTRIDGRPPDTGSWWAEMYNREAKGVPDSVFRGVVDAATPAEVLKIIAAAPAGKSAGHDGLDMGFWKLATRGDDGCSSCLALVTRINNDCLGIGGPQARLDYHGAKGKT